MNKDLVEIAVVLDSSGSMCIVRDDAIGGYNTFVEEQKKLPGKANFLLTTFGTTPNIGERQNLDDVELLNNETYIPTGMTALHDAICLTIDKMGAFLSEAKEEDRPHKVIIAILTDGMENASMEYKLEDTRLRIEHQTKVYDLEFIFLAANQDALVAGASMSINPANTMSFAMTGQSVRQATQYMSETVASLRTKYN